jgi:hypothetical protein
MAVLGKDFEILSKRIFSLCHIKIQEPLEFDKILYWRSVYTFVRGSCLSTCLSVCDLVYAPKRLDKIFELDMAYSY